MSSECCLLLTSFPGQLLPTSNDSTWMALPITTFPGQRGSVRCRFYELPRLPRLSDRQTPMLLCWVNASASFKLNPLKIDTGCYIYVLIIQHNGISILIEWTAKFWGSDRSGCKSQSHCLLAKGLWTKYLSCLDFSVFIFRTGLIIKPSVNSWCIPHLWTGPTSRVMGRSREKSRQWAFPLLPARSPRRVSICLSSDLTGESLGFASGEWCWRVNLARQLGNTAAWFISRLWFWLELGRGMTVGPDLEGKSSPRLEAQVGHES